MIGEKYGQLTVIEELSHRSRKGDRLFNCECSCGKIIEVAGYQLRNGNTQSCGCWRYRRFERGETGFNRVWLEYINSAKVRDIDFAITKDDFRELTQGICSYCGAPPSKISIGTQDSSSEAAEHSKYIYNGIDRVDSALGYTTDNTVPCCRPCNTMKMDMPKEEFLNRVKRINKHLNL